jgi:hypothetical protein
LIFQGVTAQGRDIPFNIHPERQNKINNKRGTHCQERNIHEPGTNARRSDAQSFSDSGAHAKSLPFDKVPESIHASKLKQYTKMYKQSRK